MKLFLIFLISFTAMGVEMMTGSLEVSRRNSANFTIVKEDDNYYLKLKTISSTNFCLYKIRKISSPAKLKGRNGIIQADQQNCRFKIKNEKIKKYWNDTITIDISYYFLSKKNLEGNASLNSLKNTYKAKTLLRLK
jgi:hypothetical protein